MLQLKLAKETKTEVVYNYFPEKEKEYGTIMIQKETGEIISADTAINDPYKRYLHHAISKLDEYFNKGKYLSEDVVVWC